MKCVERSQVRLVEAANLRHARGLRGHTCRPESERDARDLVWVIPKLKEHLRVNHSCPQDRDPTRTMAGRTSFAVTGPAGEVNAHARLGIRVELWLKSDPVGTVDLAHHVSEHTLEVGKGQPRLDPEAFELVEHRKMRRIHGLVSHTRPIETI